MAKLPSRLAGEDYCYLTTTGCLSGRPHEIEIWFAIEEDSLARHLLAAKYQGWREGRPLSDWARTALLVALEIIHSQVR
jgi:hypothetical protein